jgi:hypothetical protein
MIHGFSFCSIDQLLDLPDFRYTYTFSLRGFLNAIAENPLPYVLSRKTSESFRIILHVVNKHYLTSAFHTWLLEKRGFTTEQVILCYESRPGHNNNIARFWSILLDCRLVRYCCNCIVLAIILLIILLLIAKTSLTTRIC